MSLAEELENDAESATEERAAKLRRLAQEVRKLEAAKAAVRVNLIVFAAMSYCGDALLADAMDATKRAREPWERVEAKLSLGDDKAAKVHAPRVAKVAAEEDVYVTWRRRMACVERECACCGYFGGPKHARSGQRVVFARRAL